MTILLINYLLLELAIIYFYVNLPVLFCVSLFECPMQPVLALRCLGVLLDVGISQSSDNIPQLLPSYNTAVSLYNDLLLSTLGPRPKSFPKPHPLAAFADLGKKEELEILCSKLMADLSVARLQLACGQLDDTRALLLGMLSNPMLEQASTLTFMFVAKAKLLASELLQQRTFDLKCSDTFLRYICNSDLLDKDDCDHTFRLTPLELAVDAVKIFQKLASHRCVKVESDDSSANTCESYHDSKEGGWERGGGLL